MKVIIVGGVAGGASCAARLRRLDENAEDFVTGQWSLVALAGPANRQGRIAADVIAGRDCRFRGTQGTSIIGLFGAPPPGPASARRP
jgi:NADPH-dependent 2,4-dienoyl-CoA reductase/sulfur reductase-like enzyme